jgi:ribosomal protein S25
MDWFDERDMRMLFPERSLTVHQVASRYNLSEDTIRRMFLAEPGVIVISQKKPRKRVYSCGDAPGER